MKTCKWTAINKSLCNLYKPSCEKIVMALPEGTIDEKERKKRILKTFIKNVENMIKYRIIFF